MEASEELSRRSFLGRALLIAAAPIVLMGRSLAGFDDRMLDGGGFDGQPSETGLERWKSARRVPIRRSHDEYLQELINAVEEGRRFEFRYYGGSDPFKIRRLSPTAIYRVEGFCADDPNGIYVTGYCHDRGCARTFLLARMEEVQVVG